MTVPSETTPSSLTDASIPSQNGGSNVTTVSTPAFSVNADSVQKARMSAMDQIAGYIFMCNSNTKPDCFIYRVFGLPASRLAVAEKIKPNTKLFLYDFEVKLLYGMYVADSSGKMAIEPYAFGGRFPAQVKFSILRDCLPLPEAAFKEAIRENYSGGTKFNQTLTKEQVNDLVSLFRPINIPVPLGPPPPLHDGVEIRRPKDGGSTFQNAKFTSHGQYSGGYDHTNMQMYPSSSHSQPYYSQHNQVLVPETYHPDHPGLYKQDTHTRYGTAPQITAAPSQQARSSMTVAQWVALASEPQTSVGGHASSSTPTIPSSSEYQPPYSYNHHGQTQVPALPQPLPPPGDSAYMYYNSTTTQPPPPAPGDKAYLYNNSTTTQPPPPPPGDSAYMYNNPTTTQPPPPPPGESAYMYYNTTSTQPALPSSEYQYQGYHQASDQMHPVTYVSETYVPYGANTVPPDYVHQMPAAEVTDPGAGYAPTQYVGPNPTY